MDGFKQLEKTFGGMIARSMNIGPALREIAPMFGGEIVENFRKGGRGNSGENIWKESERAKREGGQTLLDTSRLMKSATVPRVDDTSITFGSDLPYAAIHQFGFDDDITVGDKMRHMMMPARPYLFISDGAIEMAGNILLAHTLGMK